MNFEITAEELVLIGKILDRADLNTLTKEQRVEIEMDLVAAHSNGCPLDFERLLNFPEDDFGHDIREIRQNIDRSTGRLGNCFLPRCVKPSLKESVG